MSPGRSPWRLFVAAYPAPDVASAYLGVLARLELPEHRATPVGQLHLTLHFVGPVDERRVGEVAESVARACSGVEAFEMRPRRVVGLPEGPGARLIAIELERHPRAEDLHDRLVQRLARSPRTGRVFVPHLTVCRFEGAAAFAGVDLPVELPGMVVDRVRLMRSVLHAEGAEHREVAARSLGAAGSGGGPGGG